MSEHPRSSKKRPYRMRERAEQVEATRQRIVEAALSLHTTVGPAQTTVSALAEKAGVTRLTVYRHFPDEETLFAACGQLWASRHPAPDPAAWRAIADVETRARHALRELYGWYHDHGEKLLPLYSDIAAIPAAAQQAIREDHQRFAEALVIGTGIRGHARRRFRAAASHTVSVWTWHSLAVEQGLGHVEAAELAAELLIAAAGRRTRRPGRDGADPDR